METQIKKAMTFQQLKDYLNSLEQWQLDCPAYVQGDDRGFAIQSAEGLDEDHYQTDEGIDPVSCFDGEDVTGYELIPKGTPYLYTDMWEEAPHP